MNSPHHEQPDLLGTIFSHVREAIIVTDVDFRVISWNSAAERIYNISAEEALNKRVGDLVQYSFFGDERANSIQQLKSFDGWTGMVNFAREDGHRVWLESTVKTLRDSASIITGYVAINNDVSSLMDLQYNHEQLVHTFSYIEEGVCITGGDYKILFCNSRFSKTVHAVFGVHMGPSNFLTKINDSGFQKVLQKQIGQIAKVEKTTSEYAVPKHDGNVATITVRAFSMPDQNREEHICFLIRNITKDKIEERRIEDLTSKKRMFESYMDSTALVAWITDQNGKKLFVNRAYRTLFGITEGYPNKHLSDLLPPDLAERYLAENAKILSDKTKSSSIEEIMLPSGKVHQYQVSRFKMPYELDGQALVAGWAIPI
jgi:PAS domain S-box-containing protein